MTHELLENSSILPAFVVFDAAVFMTAISSKAFVKVGPYGVFGFQMEWNFYSLA